MRPPRLSHSSWALEALIQGGVGVRADRCETDSDNVATPIRLVAPNLSFRLLSKELNFSSTLNVECALHDMGNDCFINKAYEKRSEL